jgi:hypothetical protein
MGYFFLTNVDISGLFGLGYELSVARTFCEFD